MIDIDDLVRASAPAPIGDVPEVRLALNELAAATLQGAPKLRRLRIALIAGIVTGALTLGAGASAAASGVVWPFLGGPADVNLAVTVVEPGQASQACRIGIRVVPMGGLTVHSSAFVAAKRFLETHDWSHLRPDPNLMTFSPAFASAHHIELKTIIAGTVATQVINDFSRSGFAKPGLSLRSVIDCSVGKTK